MDETHRTRGQVANEKRRLEEEADAVSTITSLDSREFDDFTIARDDPYHRINMPIPKRRKLREDEELWSYALEEPPVGRPARGNKNQEIFYCKRCFKDCSSATTFRGHLKNKHGIITQSRVAKADSERNKSVDAMLKDQKDTVGQMKDKNVSKLLRESVNDKDFLNSLIYLIVKKDLPHTIIESPEFQSFLYTCNYTLVEPGGPLFKSRATVPRLLGKTFVVHKENIAKKLALARSKIHLTTDCWTSPNKTAYQAVTAHFVDEFLSLSKATLALREHKEAHGGEQQAEVILQVLEEFQIRESQLGYITS